MESEERYRAIFRTMDEGCGLSRMIFDEEGKPVDWEYLLVNPAFERILGRTGLEGRRMSEVFPARNDPIPLLLQVYGRVASSGGPERLELEMPSLQKWMSISVSCPFAGHFVAVYTDITERRRMEEYLRQAQKMEAVGQLAGGVAHDFNNLLTAILGYSELLLAHPALRAADLQDDLLEIKRAAERGATLTRLMLAFARGQELKPEAVSLNDVLAGLVPLLQRSLGEHIELVTMPAPGLGLVQVDPHQMERVLLNLALNARDAMPDGGRLVVQTANVVLDDDYCRTRKDVNPGPYVLLSVSDTGHGMEEAVKERIFEPFFTTKGPGQGTGLGLSTVYGIIRQSGGHVEVESRPGKGTKFLVYLPRLQGADAGSPGVEPELSAQTARKAKRQILLVEDETAVRDLVARVLRHAGYQVTATGCATDALTLIEQEALEIDLLLTDLVLPGALQGDELVRRTLARRPELPVVFMSGHNCSALVQAGRIGPDAGYVEKPFTSEELLAQVRSLLPES